MSTHPEGPGPQKAARSLTFQSTAERDAWLDEHAPQRMATETPGLYRLPDDSALVVRMLDVSIYPPASGTAGEDPQPFDPADLGAMPEGRER